MNDFSLKKPSVPCKCDIQHQQSKILFCAVQGMSLPVSCNQCRGVAIQRQPGHRRSWGEAAPARMGGIYEEHRSWTYRATLEPGLVWPFLSEPSSPSSWGPVVTCSPATGSMVQYALERYLGQSAGCSAMPGDVLLPPGSSLYAGCAVSGLGTARITQR